MKALKSLLLVGCVFSALNLAFSQRGKEGAVTVPAGSSVVNTYTYLTADATAGLNTLTVNDNTMTGGAFGATPLAPGDLIMVIQMQGASIDVNTTPTTGWGGNYTVPNGFFDAPWPSNWNVDPHEWGQVTNYNNSGFHERVEVLSVSGANTITLNCNLVNSYTASGHVQVIRIPRYTDLTINAGSTIAPTSWDGNSGGVVALEVDGTLTLNGTISATAAGFRGGALDPDSFTAGGPPTEVRFLGSNNFMEGARKGEGIAGYQTEYAALESEYGIGAPANGGGGGGYQNTGGGGGSNVIVGGTYTGKGNPQGYSAIWDLEQAGFGGSTSAGGGRGGYAYSNNDLDETTIGPRNAAWGGDDRKNNGGFGAHPLPFLADRIWFGGGGGAGDQDSDEGGAGGRGGGIVFMNTYGTITGSGTIEANGEDGQNTNPTNGAPSAGNVARGEDGAGGGGAGGTIHVINVSPFPATITLNVIGGDGGDQNLSNLFAFPDAEAGGPGGSGTGGYIRITSGSPTRNLTAGANGTTSSTQMVNFPPNGATEGSDGFPAMPANPAFNLTGTDVTICSGNTANLSVTQFGTAPGTVTWYDAMVGGTAVNTGTTFTTPSLGSTTTYWVGTCPGSFREPITVTTISCLPVELAGFWTECDPYPVLHWQTASEHNNDYFTIERSCDLTHYEELAQIEGLENSMELMEYIYHDDKRNNCIDDEMYYRLSQTDLDGSRTVVGILSSHCEQEILEPKVATTNNAILIQYAEDFKFNMYTTDGKLVHHGESQNAHVLVPKTGLKSGIYLIQILADRQFNSRVFVK